MKFFRSSIFLFSIFAVLLFIPSILFAEFEEKIEKAYPFTRDGKIYLENMSGDIVVKSWRKNEIRLLARKVALDESMMDGATVEINRTDSNIRIVTRHEKSLDLIEPMDISVYYDLFIPDRAQLKVKSTSGSVQAWEIGGRTDIETVNGGITVVKIKQGVKCKTISGDIILEEIIGNAALESTSGKIYADGLQGSIEASSVSGDIVISAFSSADEITIETIKGNMEIEGELNPGGIYEFNTISGKIELAFSPVSEFELRTNTINGDIKCGFELSDYAVYTRNKVEGIVGNGGAGLRVSSVSGDIVINKSKGF